MNQFQWQWPKKLAAMLEIPAPDPPQQTSRILAVQRNIVLPARVMVTGVVLYYLFYSRWLAEVATTQGVVLETLQNFFVFYVLFQAGAASVLLVVKRFPLGMIQWLVFTVGLLDGLMLAGLTLVTGGFESILFWVFPGLIVVNALSIPLAMPQIVLNLMLSGFYLGAGSLAINVGELETTALYLPPTRKVVQPSVKSQPARHRILVNSQPEAPSAEVATEPFLLRLIILWLMTISCYGVRALLEKQRHVEEEAQEFAARQEQLAAAGRLAAEIAHQMKNPLGIINNAAFSLQRALREGKGDAAQQIQIIQEEVERSDRIITQLIGYAQLSEGRVEKLSVIEELERAVEQVFPRGAQYEIQIHRDYAAHFPPLLMQRAHLLQVFVNLLQNAREALRGKGNIFLSAHCQRDYSIEVIVRDDGPGIAADKLGKIFDAYFTSKERGTGLGLAIVKHNVELYGGTVRVESELGQGARFILLFPAKLLLRLGP
ncbi:MAG: GHKL domain-containing protein [Verrucomicrobia bacterium]|nr:GHKL domain-containing protein [Verrucomicrobiota bacterium]